MALETNILFEKVHQFSFSSQKALKLLEAMYVTRFTDEKMSKLVRQNKGGTFHLSVCGHEMIGCAAGLALESKKDWGTTLL